MKALLLTEYLKFSHTEMPEPEVGEMDVRVRVQACGICGSDVHGFDGSTGRRIPPLIMGHEAAGIIESVGSGVTRFRPGDRVTFDSMVSCGRCHFCRRGFPNLCDARQVLGVSCGEYRRHGAFAELVSVPEHIVYRLPEGMPFEEAAMVEAVSVALHAVHRTPIRLGDTAVVVGTGMIGSLVVQALKIAGVGRVIAVDLDDAKLALASSLGADVVLRGDRDDVPVRVRELTEGRGADVALEVVGATATVRTAIESVRKGGSVCLVGNVSPKIELPLQSVVTREISLFGTCGCNGEYPACLELMGQGRMKVAPLISRRVTLAETPEWFERLHRGEPGLMKVIVEPSRA